MATLWPLRGQFSRSLAMKGQKNTRHSPYHVSGECVSPEHWPGASFMGDGSLMTAALAENPPPEPSLDNREYCGCLAQVFEALVAR